MNMQLIYVSKIPIALQDWKLEAAIADRLHNPPISAKHGPPGGPLNFSLVVFKHKDKSSPFKSGRLVIPDAVVAKSFLQSAFMQPIYVMDTMIFFKYDAISHADADLLKHLLEGPHVGPAHRKIHETKEQLSSPVKLSRVQLGSRNRQGHFTNEADLCGSEEHCFATSGSMMLDQSRGHLLLGLEGARLADFTHIAIQIRSISHIYIEDDNAKSKSLSESSVLLLCHHPVTLERMNPARLQGDLDAVFKQLSLINQTGPHKIAPWMRLSQLPTKEAQSPYVLYDVRISGRNINGFFSKLCVAYHRAPPIRILFPVTAQAMYTDDVLGKVEASLLGLPLNVAYQAQKLLSNRLLNPAELLAIIKQLFQQLPGSADIAARALQHMAESLDPKPALPSAGQDTAEDPAALQNLLESAIGTAEQENVKWARRGNAYHRVGRVHLSPTRMSLRGPFPDVSNRVLRRFDPQDHHYFLNVTFCEEDPIASFSNQGIYDVRSFVAERFGGVMKKGLKVGGRVFQFLAYSQSSLKEYTVWFVTPFLHEGTLITAKSIRNSLGDFSKTIRLVAKYAARLSQAFTTTQGGLRVSLDQVETVPDVKRGKYTFTDGCGCISPQLADQITSRLVKNGENPAIYASAFQIRFAGYKGMLFVNPDLEGDKITVRDSMQKFDAPTQQMVEIVEVFIEPRGLCLNKPLIQCLEHLGVPAEAFLDLQKHLVADIKAGTSSLEAAVGFSTKHTFGGLFRVPRILQRLFQMQVGLQQLPPRLRTFMKRLRTFMENALAVARTSALREIKFECRLPLFGCYTLVGGFDESRDLREGEVFVCVMDGTNSEPRYLEGDLIVTRSPVVDPGDIRRVRAIGHPTSPFLCAQRNVIISSGEGARPVPSEAGGGDLDGDLYQILTEAAKAIWPRRIAEPGAYDDVVPKDLGRSSTIEDIADFVADYIVSDLLGVVSSKLMQIADQSALGFDDPDCKILTKLASAAVDYPKSGVPVTFSQIPRTKSPRKPDFMADEGNYKGKISDQHYLSEKALGQLFRACELPGDPLHVTAPDVAPPPRPGRRRRWRRNAASLASVPDSVLLATDYDSKVKAIVSPWISTIASTTREAMSAQLDFYSDEIMQICYDHGLSSDPLDETELFIGAIVGPRKGKKRRIMLTEANKDLAALLDSTRFVIGPDNPAKASISEWQRALVSAYAAWEISLERLDRFGSCSFNMLAFEAMFRCIDKLSSLEG